MLASPYFIPVLIMAVLLAISLTLRQRAAGALTAAQKEVLAAVPKAGMKPRLITWGGIFVFFCILSAFTGEPYPAWFMIAFVIALLASFIAFAIADARRLREHGVPAAFARATLIADLLAYCGFLVIAAYPGIQALMVGKG